MSELVVREARVEDLPACVEMLAADQLGVGRERPGEPLDPGYLRAFEAIRATPGHTLLVGELDGRVVGVLQLMLLPHLTNVGSLRAQVEGVRVAADLRGRGLGHRLMEAAIERARAAGAGVLQLTTNRARDDAQRFYADLGFEPSHVGMKLSL